MISERTYQLCRDPRSVSSELAKNPTEAPVEVAKRLYASHPEHAAEEANDKADIEGEVDLERAFECGNWGSTRPSELFLRIYHDVLQTFNEDPLVDVCSPSLAGSHGVCPLTIISGIPDIARHMSNLIVRAEHEVFLATNFWMHSEPSRLISNALVELSRRSADAGRRAVVKILYDRGSLKQVIKNHQKVPESEYANPEGPIRLPHPEQIPNVDVEIVNYHRPMLGTFHAKFLVVDRRFAIVQSDNIQDNENLEMCVQLEGPIVDSIYDTALNTWNDTLVPPMPCINTPAASLPIPSFEPDKHQAMFHENGTLLNTYHNASANGELDPTQAASEAAKISLPQHTSETPHYDPDLHSELLRSIAAMNPRPSERRIDAVARHLNTTPSNTTKATAPDTTSPSDIMTPLIPVPIHAPFPMAMVSRPPYGSPNLSSLKVPQNIAFISALRNCRASILIQTPNLNAQDLIPELLAAARRGIKLTLITCLGYNDAGELLPLQGGHNEGVAHRLYTALEPQFHENLDMYCYVAKDQTGPIHKVFQKRSCHIKLMIVDACIGIMGSGNQDSQSWYHSQEMNVMLDSADVVRCWDEALRRNQNTWRYGLVRKGDPTVDKLVGCWVDEDGKLAEGTIGSDPGRFSWFKGMKGAVDRVRGDGGF